MKEKIKPDISKFRSCLLRWYRKNQRDLPWRRRVNLYRTLVSEFMLQQTRVDQAIPYFDRFMKRFPDMKSLASAPLGNVMKLWEGMGYYHRAGQLHATARNLAGKRDVTLDTLRSCPGIGPYMAAAISSIVWNEPLAVVDGNVKRVVARFLAIDQEIESTEAKSLVEAEAARWLFQKNSGDWNQAVMELGATVCTPRAPLCPSCPIRSWCRAYRMGAPEKFPRRKEKMPRPHRQVVAGVLLKNNRVLIARRPPKGLLPNLWEFPGGYCEEEDNLEGTLKKMIRRRTGIDVRVGEKIGEVKHAYSHHTITLHVFRCRYGKGEISSGQRDVKWVSPGGLGDHAFPRAQWGTVERLQRMEK